MRDFFIMKFSVLREKTSSLEEGPMINQDENSTTSRTEKNYNWTGCLRFTKVSFYVVMILLVGWFFMVYMGFNYEPRTFGTHMFSKNDRPGDDAQILLARDFLRTTMQDERKVWVSTADDEINPEPFIQHGTHSVKPKFRKPDSSEDKTDSNEDIRVSTTLPFVEIEESTTVKSINGGRDSDQSDTSEGKVIADKNFETWAFGKSEESSTMKIINPERDSDESDSTKEKIISHEYSTISTLPLTKITESSSVSVSISDERDNDSPKDKILSNEHTEASRDVDDSNFTDWLGSTNDSEYDDSYEDDYSSNW